MKEIADKLLYDAGLWNCLSEKGNPHIVGSYLTGLMSWNDLDIYMEESDDYHGTVAALITELNPEKFEGFTRWGYNFGFETYVDGERINVDIWWKSAEDITAANKFAEDVKEKISLHPEYRDIIIAIKQELISRKMYGFDKGKLHYHSDEIYRAVFEEGIRTPEEFLIKYAK